MARPGLVPAGPGPARGIQEAHSHTSHDVPIVFPGQPGSAHLHDFVGARSAGAHSTSASLRAGGTTCVMDGDASA